MVARIAATLIIEFTREETIHRIVRLTRMTVSRHRMVGDGRKALGRAAEFSACSGSALAVRWR